MVDSLTKKPTAEGQPTAKSGCFLCAPETALIYHRDSPIFAMAGYGPVVDGYSVIAHEQHIPSMGDLSESDIDSASAFLATIRGNFSARFGSCAFSEHGRISVCAELPEGSDDPHCYHAHFLAFPGAPNPVKYASTYFRKVAEFSTLETALGHAREADEYFLFSPTQESFFVMIGGLNVPRQFARQVIAISMGRPDLADWRRNPNRDDALRIASDLRGHITTAIPND